MRTKHTKPLPIIAVIGADGSGKSTVIESIVNNYSHKRVNEIYVLQRSTEKDDEDKESIQNYSKKSRSYFVSTLKIVVKAFFWTFRYWFHIIPNSRRGILVLCDHFYFLATALDPLKYRHNGSARPLWFIFRWVPKPEAYILLDSSVDVFYKRKQESPREDVQNLIEKHRSFIESKMISGFTINASLPLEQVTAKVSQVITQVIESS